MNKATIKIYFGYGHTHNLVLYGHVFRRGVKPQKQFTNRILINILHLLQLFFVKPYPKAKVRLHWMGQQMETLSEDDGFFKFEWESNADLNAGWHPVSVEYINEQGGVGAIGEGKLLVPHITQYVFISDIDDTVMVSYSATKFRRLKELLTRNPRTRKQFERVADWYQQLAITQTTPQTPNPFFYVSSSEWNLYDYLHEFFGYNKLPEGLFLLNQVKQWFQFFKTGKTNHSGKLIRIARILEVFPKQQFILIGDNTQHDPDIYTTLATKHPDKILAVFIRNVRPEKQEATRRVLEEAGKIGVHTYLFNSSDEAQAYSRRIGLLQ